MGRFEKFCSRLVHRARSDFAQVCAATVTALQPQTRDQPSRLTLSVVPSRLPRSSERFPRRSGQVALGLQPPSQAAPAPPSAEEFAQRKRGVRPWAEQLLESRAFYSPACVAAMAAAYNIPQARPCLCSSALLPSSVVLRYLLSVEVLCILVLSRVEGRERAADVCR